MSKSGNLGKGSMRSSWVVWERTFGFLSFHVVEVKSEKSCGSYVTCVSSLGSNDKYRLWSSEHGALGFLSTGDEVSPGNYGLKDQSLALKWIKRNIKHFNGDPSSVTLFGESAGGASANYHMLSPLSKGLFKGVISQSGTSFCVWSHAPAGENKIKAKKLGQLVGCPTTSSKELVECLRGIDPMVFVKHDRDFMDWDFDPMIPFKPVVEPPSKEAFLIDTPANLFKAGKFADVPWIVGVNKEDGLLRSAAYVGVPKLFEELDEDFNNKTAISLMYEPFAENPNLVSEKIRKFYFGDRKKLNFENSFKDLTDMYTDGWFTKCIDDAIRIHLKVSKQPVYNYLFAHRSGASFSEIFGAPGEVHGVCHADELQYLFPVGDGLFPHKKVTDEDRRVRRLMTTMWENFAKTGNPTPVTDDLITTKWTPIKSENLEYLHIDGNTLEMKDALFKERVKFWRSLPLEPKKVVVKDEL
ncbi:venom carboxylesterase-6-like isoform X2 [Harmonia axyridis]|uniref:venom carboxylesterase-6-like isoform X2 n=1 Tax=Harmonia axyridis TaxID=115357 RepID=UPI001E277D84|nr:venom carboxylesterase-6-like isoform X2 [Harmonia axyridis]